MVGLISLIWTLWFWCVFGFGSGVLSFVWGGWFKCCGFYVCVLGTSAGWWAGWVVCL